MRCEPCGADNPPANRFCGNCGAPLVVACLACGQANPPTNHFCGQCGSRLTGPAAPIGRPPPAAPGSYTPAHLAEKILTSRSALEGERKQVTVLFADLKGSLELLTDRDPEEARGLLDPVLEHMMAAVHRYEGTVNQVMGDGIMALFGAPLAHEDHALRACYAALSMQDSVGRYAEELRRSRGIDVQIRVGLNSGEVVVRAVGSDLKLDYSAVGQTVHLAARMEQLARPGAILLAPETLRLSEGFVEVKPLGPVPVKGLAEPVDDFELVGAGAVRTRLQASAARGLTRFVGRRAELEAVHAALERAETGHGQMVALVGEPGVGKSRLVWEVVHSHRTSGWLVLEGGSLSYGKTTSYLPVIDLLKTYCGIEPRDDGRRICEKLTGKLITLDRALEPDLAALLALLDVQADPSTSSGQAAWEALDPAQRRQRTHDAVKRLLLREAREQPLLVVFEDLHWIDGETQALLNGLVESLPTTRLLLLVNYRPEYGHSWGSKTYYSQLRLDPLPPASADELLGSLLGDHSSLHPLKPLLVERTEGNPLFLEESVRTLVETQILVGERGAYRLTGAVSKVAVPATVQAVLAARIDRLPPEDKRLLQSAAVIGKDVPLALLQAIADQSEDDLRAGLAHLQAAEFLYESSLFPEPEYTFKHALTHEVAYGSLLQERRRALHAGIVEAIELLHAGRLDEQLERLAQHALRGEVWDKAVAYAQQAGAKAVDRSAYREAAASYEQALAALPHLPEDRAALERAIDIRLDLRRALAPLAEIQRSLERLREAEAIASRLDDQERLGRVSAHLAVSLLRLGQHEQAIVAGERALAIATATGDVAAQGLANLRLGQTNLRRGEYGRAVDFLRRSGAILAGDLVLDNQGQPGLPAIEWRNFLSDCLATRGEFGEGLEHSHEAVRLAEAVGQLNSLASAHTYLGILLVQKGDFEQGVAPLERGFQVGQQAHQSAAELAQALLVIAYRQVGRTPEALRLLEQRVEHLAAAVDPRVFIWMGEGCLSLGRRDAAVELARQAMDLARNRRERGHLALGLRLLGEIAAQAEPPDLGQAEDHYRQALALAEELGMRPFEAHCRLGLGALYRQAGRNEYARAHIAQAVEMYRAMSMAFWLPRAEDELSKTA